MRRIGERPVTEIIIHRVSGTSLRKQALSDNDLGIILDAGRRATSRFNLQPWKFLLIRTSEMKDRIFQLCANKELAKECEAIVAVFATSDPVQETYREAVWNNENRLIPDNLINAMRAQISNLEKSSVSALAISDASFAASQMLFTCEALGHPAAIIDSFDEREIKTIVAAPEGTTLVAILALGVRKSRDRFLTFRTPIDQVAYAEKWGTPSELQISRKAPPFQYFEAIISYFDILGFRHIINTWDADKIGNVLLALTRLSRPHPEIIDIYDLGFFSFSDHIVRVVDVNSDYDPNDRTGLLFHELMELAVIQVNLLRSGVLVRGAVTLGNITAERGLIFGPALVRAYEIEQSVAAFPRIVIDPRIIEAIEKGSSISRHSAQEEKAYLQSLVWNGSDGICFVDYLNMVDSPEEGVAVLMMHKALVETQLLEQPELNGVTVKYNWLIGYHNEVVSEIPEDVLTTLKQSRESLRIDTGNVASWGNISSDYPI